MRESAVCLSHLVRVIPLFDGVPLTGSGIPDFGREIFCHCPSAILREVHKPSHCERNLPILRDLNRDLIGRPTNTPGLHLQPRFRVFQRLVKRIERINRI
jgi:hypothetical protein